MKIGKTEFENKRDSIDATITSELPQDTTLALFQANLLDALIEQGATFTIPPYIQWADRFLNDLLSKAQLVIPGHYRVYIRLHSNSAGTFYSGIIVMPHYQLTNLEHNTLLVGQFEMKG